MDKGTDAKAMLEGKDVPLLHGYVGLKCRSKQDILDNMSVADGIEKEKAYFNSHKVYVGMDQSKLGVTNLTNKLSNIMFFHIKRSLPLIVKDIREKMKTLEQDLAELGEPMPSAPHEKLQLLWSLMTEFIQTYKNSISGRYDANRYQGGNIRSTEPLTGGAKIKKAFHNLYSDLADYKATSDYSVDHIETAI